MPFIDLNTQNSIDQYANTDFIIIGAGAAGILLAVKLTEKGKKVVVIESGHFNVDDEKQKLNEVISLTKVLNTAVYGRFRAIGGTTVRWGGGSSSFSKIDFQQREWVSNSGWPISYEEVLCYYDEVNKFMQIDERLNFLNINDPGFNPGLLDFHICKWAPEPNFQKIYKKYLKKNVAVIYNAVLQKLNYQNSNVENISISNFKNKIFTIKSKCIILAAGGIECNRILLSNPYSEDTNKRSNLLGKMFMEHPSICVGAVKSKKYWQLQKIFNTHFFKNAKYSIRLNLSEQLQKENKVLNCTAGIMLENAIGEDPYSEIKNLRTNFSVKRLLKISKFIPTLIKTFYALVIHNFIYKPEAEAKLVLMAEQEPLSESYIALSKDCDSFGIPKAEISWSISNLSWKTIVLSSFMIKKEIERLGLGEVIINKDIYYDNTDWLNLVSDVNHHMGGVRMSNTPDNGVVDTNLKLWGIDNLYVCSSAVFPTGSHSNPTATMLALGLRLVDFLTGKSKNI